MPSLNGDLMSLEEIRSFEYFRLRTIPQLSGFFDSSFWSYYVLQTAAHESSIRHATIALGSLHERFEAGDPSILGSNLDRLEGGFALQQYTKAIGKLIAPLSEQCQQTLDIALTACVLFICFEVTIPVESDRFVLKSEQILRGHHGSALSHISNGLKILRETLSQKDQTSLVPSALALSKAPQVPLDTLQVLFARFDSQSLQLGVPNGPMSFRAFEGIEPGFTGTIPAKFSSLREARNSMDYQEHIIHRWLHTLDDAVGIDGKVLGEVDAERRRLFRKMECWHNALETLTQASTALTSRDAHAVKSLQVRYLTLETILSMTELKNEMIWDTCMEHFALMVDLATQVIEESTGFYALNDKNMPTFSLDAGCTAPMFHVAKACRDPVIRRKAIKALQYAPRQEGVWDGILAARVAERLVELEEDGIPEAKSCADIPRDARIASIDIQWDLQEKMAVLSYSKRYMFTDPNEIRRETIIW
ncbi:MAG: hypothetical protein M1822_008465 [Bathelium mastoideum]|nr:MAG: hypothetical protein M1822_008465 [Bathelium mastoideum]